MRQKSQPSSIMDSRNSSPVSSLEMDTDEPVIIGPIKRKNKSLLALCKRFLELYPLDMPQGSSLDIPLEHLSETLKLSRRRLYDIINIMESLQMAVKVTKNLYRWYGTRNVQALLSQLKDMSEKELCIELIQLTCPPPTPDTTEQHMSQPMQPPCTPQDNASAQSLLIRSMAQLPQYIQTPCTPQGGSSIILTPMAAPPTPQTSSKKQKCNLNSMKESPEPKRPHHWKMKSLGGTCLKFLTLFFKHQTVSLDWAGRVLLCGNDEEKPSSQEDTSAKEQDRQLRNKVRRIYDVANVLSALGLVCKISSRNSSSRKLLYAYSGPAIGSLTPAVQGSGLAVMEPPKPVRRVKKQELEIDNLSREQRQTTEGVCKRRLDLYKVQESPHCKRLLQDDTVIEDSSSALSILLAVAEQELKGFTTPRAEAPVARNSLPEQLKTCKIDKPKPVCNQTSNQSVCNEQGKDDLSSNQENACRGKNVGSKQIPNQSISFNYGNRSALRSLLENNRTAPVKSEFPIIQKFVVLNEENIQSRIAVTNTGINPVQTVLIRNVSGACQVVRRNALSIPYQLNMNGIATPRIVTHLDIGLGKSSTPQ